MNTGTVKQRLKSYKLFSLLIPLKREMESFPYLIYYLKGLIKLRIRKKLSMSFLYGDGMILQCEETIHIKER